MKTYAIIGLGLLVVIFTGCAPGFLKYTTTSDRFDTGAKLYAEKRYDESRAIFRSIADDNREQPVYPRAEFNDAYISMLIEDYDRAEREFRGLLAMDLDDREPSGEPGLMGEPYINYKHRICLMLADIAMKRNDYATALRYVGLADSVHPYHHFCGNEIEWERIRFTLLYSRCREGLGDTLGALRMVLPGMLYNVLASPEALQQRALEILKHRYTREELKAMMERALDELRPAEYVSFGESTRGYNLRLLGTDIFVPMILSRGAKRMSRDKSLDEMKQKIVMTPFYRELVGE